jgi:hypothetical protein
VTASARPARPGGRLDLILGSTLAVALLLIGLLAAGGTELGPNTWIQVALVAVGAGMAIAVLLAGAKGARHGLAALVAFAVLAALTYASIAWSVQPATSWLEANRIVSYLGAFGAAIALARLAPARWSALVGAVAAATTAICAYALLLKSFPGAFDRVEQLGRLVAPLDYWNAVGVVAAMGLPACLWAGTRQSAPRWSRALAPPAIAVLIATLVLSYSRGSLIVAGLGVIIWFALVPLRLRGALILGIGSVGGAAVSAWALPSHALTADFVPLAQRIGAGRWLGLVILLAALASGLAGWIAAVQMDRVRLGGVARRRVSIALIGLVALLPVGGIGALAASSRGLTGEVSHIWTSLTSTSGVTSDQPGRLVSLSNSRPRYWSQGLHIGGQHLLAGTGALGFATASLRYASEIQRVGHAHSYPVETFADLGLIGLAVSLALLIAWGLAALRPLRAPPGAASRPERNGMLTLMSVVVVFGLHSLIDWTWFIPGAAVIALVCAGWLAGRGPLGETIGLAGQRRRLLATPWLGFTALAITAAGVLAIWVIVQPLRAFDADSAAIAAIVRGQTRTALTEARTAQAADPVSVEPLFLLSEIYAAEGKPGQARLELVKATTTQPSNPETWLQLGSYDVDHHQPAAIAELQRAQSLYPRSSQIAAALSRARRVS